LILEEKDNYQQSFVGIAFHGLDSNTLDAIYFRHLTFNQLNSVRRIHAVAIYFPARLSMAGSQRKIQW